MVDWSSLNTVFLDMDGTLLDLHFDNHFWLEHLPARYAEHYDLHPQEAKDRLIPMIMAERGSLNWYCTDYWSERLSLDITGLKAEVGGLDTRVDAIVSSHQLGKPKEDPSFWQDLQRVTPYQAESTLMVDDSFPVLESALAAGIAQCLAVLAPDSQQEAREQHPEIPCIHHFDEILPALRQRSPLPSGR